MRKVFVLSLHRCGTASVSKYLGSIGFRSKHCPKVLDGLNYEVDVGGIETDHDAVFQHVKPVLDAYEAVSDVPVPVLWPQLVEAYPKALFVLLTRPVGDWIASVRRHCGGREFSIFERVQYWTYLEGQPKSIDDVSDAQLEAMFVTHAETVTRGIPSSDLFVGDLYSNQVGHGLSRFLNRARGRFPHMNATAMNDKPNRYAVIDQFGSIRHLRRFDMLAFLIWRNGWTRGAELGVHLGTTSEHLLGQFPDLDLTGVDFFAYPPLEVGGEPRPSNLHEDKRRKVRAIYSKFKGRARLLEMPTHEAAGQVDDGALDFVFIDADHRYEAVKQDIADWTPKLKPQGWLIGHDYFEHFDGVMRAVHEAFGGRHVTWPKTLWGMRRDMIGA